MLKKKTLFLVITFVLLAGIASGVFLFSRDLQVNDSQIVDRVVEETKENMFPVNSVETKNAAQAAQIVVTLKDRTSAEKAQLLTGTYATTSLAIDQKLKLTVQIADTQDLQMLGLSGRNGLARDGGLLFVFKVDGYYPFWMKDMLFPIDMIWINVDHKITHIEHMVNPDTYPQTFASPSFARYVLEVDGGVVQAAGINVGDTVVF